MSVDDPDAEADSIQGSMNFTIHFISLHITSFYFTLLYFALLCFTDSQEGVGSVWSMDDPDAEADSIQGSMNFAIHFILLCFTLLYFTFFRISN